MATKTRIEIAVVSAVALVVIVAAVQILEDGVYHDRLMASQEDSKERNDSIEFQRPSPAMESPTPNATSKTRIDSTSSFAGLPDFRVLRWPASEYEAVFGLGEPAYPLAKVHADFVNEPRDSTWASAMESGISQALVLSDANAEIMLDYIECRETICEVAGFMPDRMQNPELDPYSLFPDDLGAGWWQGRINMGIGTHTYEGEGITRFIVIIAEPHVFLSASEGY